MFVVFPSSSQKAEQRSPNQNSDEVTGAAADQNAFAGRRFPALASPRLPTLLRHGSRGGDARYAARSRQRQRGLLLAARFHQRQRLLLRLQPRQQTLGGEFHSQADGSRELGRDPAAKHGPPRSATATAAAVAQPEMRAVSKSRNQQNGEGPQTVLPLPEVCVCELHVDRAETESNG